SMLLSCRVLGRGVEHAMLARIGALALERGKARVDVRFVPTSKNQPASNFLEGIAGAHRVDRAGGAVYQVPAEVAAGLRYTPGTDVGHPQQPSRKAKTAPEAGPCLDRSATLTRIATELRHAEAILRAVERGGVAGRP